MSLATISTSIGQTTASHQIAAKTDVVKKMKKGRTKGEKQHPEPEPDTNNTSDEDDTLERKAALSSPIKGIAARKANKVSNNYPIISNHFQHKL